jgi:hypothetical protein
MIIRANLLAALLILPWMCLGQGVDMEAEANRFSAMYFVQMDGANFFRMYDPANGMIEFRRRWPSWNLQGAAGWSASKDGDAFVVRCPNSKVSYVFRKGRPHILNVDGKKIRMQFEEEPSMPGGLVDMWDGAEEEARQFHAKKWPGRFAPFYGNPNHSAVLFALFAAVGVWLFLYGSRIWWWAAGAVVSAVSLWLLVKTGGRGGIVALGVAGVVMVGFRLFRREGRWRACVLAAMAVLAAVFLFAGGSIGRISTRISDKGNVSRMEVWKSAPRMMVDAPLGWGETGSGRAYSDWYQPLTSSFVTPTLTSDHLTYMVDFGWFGRFLWVFAWTALLAALVRFAVGGGSPLPLALFTILGVASVFNPLLHVKTLWLLPLASLGFFLVARPWKEARRYLLPGGIALAVSLAVLVAFYLGGSGDSRNARPRIHTDGDRVFIGSEEPSTWIVDDRYTLGWLFAPKEIRYFYSHIPNAGALGYAQSVKSVPARVGRLVLAGRRCAEYIDLWKAGKAPSAVELLFISPAMPLASVPERLRRESRFKMVVGEFAARYEQVYGKIGNSDEIAIAEGAEVYVPGWVGLAVGR